MSGRVVHFELPFDDAARAHSFYANVFGWQVMALPEMGYTLVMSGPSGDHGPTEPGFINGGMRARQDPFAAPNIVIEVENLEDTLRVVNEAGGSTVSERQAVGDIGFAAYFRDPEGNVVGLWETAGAG